MRVNKGFWFAALEALTGEDPASGAETTSQARQAWINWATSRGLLS
jgi:hypothetical protein